MWQRGSFIAAAVPMPEAATGCAAPAGGFTTAPADTAPTAIAASAAVVTVRQRRTSISPPRNAYAAIVNNVPFRGKGGSARRGPSGAEAVEAELPDLVGRDPDRRADAGPVA